MRLTRVDTEAGDIVERRFIVEDITEDDIGAPSQHFVKFVRGLEGFAFLNTFTMDEFTNQVRQRFVSGQR